MEKAKLVLCIPGTWKDRSDLITSVVSKSAGYLLAGNILYHQETKKVFPVEFADYHPAIARAFKIASIGKMSEEDLNAIEEHTMTVYVVAEVTWMDSIRFVIHAGNALLSSGGLAVKIETTGIAHGRMVWNELANSKNDHELYNHLVTFVSEEETYASYGMQTFGLPDVAVPKFIHPQEAAEIMNIFNLYRIFERPSLNHGETFSINPQSPRFRLVFTTDKRYTVDDSFYNPFGVWMLHPIETIKD